MICYSYVSVSRILHNAVGQWIALWPHSKKVTGLHPSPISESPSCLSQGFLYLLQFSPTVPKLTLKVAISLKKKTAQAGHSLKIHTSKVQNLSRLLVAVSPSSSNFNWRPATSLVVDSPPLPLHLYPTFKEALMESCNHEYMN